MSSGSIFSGLSITAIDHIPSFAFMNTAVLPSASSRLLTTIFGILSIDSSVITTAAPFSKADMAEALLSAKYAQPGFIFCRPNANDAIGTSAALRSFALSTSQSLLTVVIELSFSLFCSPGFLPLSDS